MLPLFLPLLNKRGIVFGMRSEEEVDGESWGNVTSQKVKTAHGKYQAFAERIEMIVDGRFAVDVEHVAWFGEGRAQGRVDDVVAQFGRGAQ